MLPVNCILNSNFHGRLIATTVFPILVVMEIMFIFSLQKLRLEGDEIMHVKARSIRVTVIFLFTVFPMVSTTIFQTFQFDKRLSDGSAYLVADHSIRRDDPVHRAYVAYASLMAILYCFGIPMLSMYLLHWKKDGIQKIQFLSQSIANLESGCDGHGIDDLHLKRTGSMDIQH